MGSQVLQDFVSLKPHLFSLSFTLHYILNCLKLLNIRISWCFVMNSETHFENTILCISRFSAVLISISQMTDASKVRSMVESLRRFDLEQIGTEQSARQFSVRLNDLYAGGSSSM